LQYHNTRGTIPGQSRVWSYVTCAIIAYDH